MAVEALSLPKGFSLSSDGELEIEWVGSSVTIPVNLYVTIDLQIDHHPQYVSTCWLAVIAPPESAMDRACRVGPPD